MCVMAGIDYMTIARWAGHQDGGILIGKVYGHLSNDHAQTQAGRLTFGPVLVNEASHDPDSLDQHKPVREQPLSEGEPLKQLKVLADGVITSVATLPKAEYDN
jgi:hypothetical protein